MRKSSFSDAEIIDVVRAFEAGRPPHELCDTWQVSMRTLYRWKRKFGTLKPFAVQALRSLEQENHRLRSAAAHPTSSASGLGEVANVFKAVRSDLGSGDPTRTCPSPPTVVGRYASLRTR